MENTENKQLPAYLDRAAFGLITFGFILIFLLYPQNPQRVTYNYLIFFMFILSLGVGSLFLIAIEFLTGAVWSAPLRRGSEFLAGFLSGPAGLPMLMFLVIPLAFGFNSLFHHWIHPDVSDHVLHGKHAYLNVGFFWIRFIVYIMLWSFFYIKLVGNSTLQDETRDPKLTDENITYGGFFIPVFALTITVAAMDWMMSLSPHWFSTIYGVYYFSGTVVASFSALTLITVFLNENGFLKGVTKDHYYNLGAYMFAFNVFWAYIAFSQFILIWYANLPEETYWFLQRWNGNWWLFSWALLIFHFILPFFILLPRENKKDPAVLTLMAFWLLLAHGMDLYWLIVPNFSKNALFGWVEVGFILITSGFVLAMVCYKARGATNLMPIGDPRLQRGLHFRL